MEFSEPFDQIATALVEAQKLIGHAPENAQNPHLKTTYADLKSVLDTVKPAFSAHGLAVLQAQLPASEGWLCLETRLLHTSGQWVKTTTTLALQKTDAHTFGAALTYARRYSLMALCGVATEDDDGNANTQLSRPRPPQQNTAPRPQERPQAPSAPAQASRPTTAPATTSGAFDTGAGISAPAGAPCHVCSHPGCGKPLTPGQSQMSIRSFNAELCPQHQREQPRASA